MVVDNGFGVDSKTVIDGCQQLRRMDWIFQRRRSSFITLAVNVAAACSGPGHDSRVAVGPVISTVIAIVVAADRLAKADPHSILEIGIHDRSLDILDQLTRPGHSTPIRYIAVDEFEMGDSQVTLREYHQQLREFPAKAHLVPMPVEQGLQRVLTTYGQMDLVFWNHEAAPSETQLQFLSRLAKPTTVFLTRVNDRWDDSLSQAIQEPAKRAA